MAEPFKYLLNETVVRQAGAHLQRAWPAFDQRGFARRALAGLEGLEMKARAMQIADALQAFLPQDFATAAAVVEAALAPARADESTPEASEGLAGWIVWPLGEWVARAGMAQPERALPALRELTQRLTAEFAIRPFIVAHPALVFATLERWCSDASPHVRRLVSEGSRPRLPWGMQLKALVADPSPTLPLLERLQDDPSEYVRRSVANHLNDIAKDHPALVAAWVRQHLEGAGRERRALLKHASRTLIKRGDAQLLTLWGAGQPFAGRARLRLTPRRVVLGGAVTLAASLHSDAAQAQALLIDIAVHFVRADGSAAPKVFKGWQFELGPGERRELQRLLPMRPVTTRRAYAGVHRVEVVINGRVEAGDSFRLALA